MNSDYNKDRAHKLKEELHYVIDEKNQQADLTEVGRSLISPKDPDGLLFLISLLCMLKLIGIKALVMKKNGRKRKCRKRLSGKK